MRFIESAILLLAFGSSCHAGIFRWKEEAPKGRLYARQSSSLQDFCPLDSDNTNPIAAAINRFSGYAIAKFDSSATDFAGPIAAGGLITLTSTTGVSIGSSNPGECSAGGVESYGLVAGDSILVSATTSVSGNIGIGLNGAINGDVVSEGTDCGTYTGDDLVVFGNVADNLVAASEYFASMTPHYRFDGTGAVTSTGNPESGNYNVFLVDTCSSTSTFVGVAASCASYTSEYLSDPSGILYSGAGWNGVDTSSVVNPGATVVINIPVRSSLVITTSDPSLNLNDCNTIYNFYPANDDGTYNPDSNFQITYEGSGTFQGFILAPSGVVQGSTLGNFAGKVFADTILDYNNLGTFSTCPAFEGCFPIQDYSIELPTSCNPTTTTTKTESTTTTTTVGTLTTTDKTTATVTHETTIDSTTMVTVTGPGTTTTLTTTATDTYTSIDSTQVTTTTVQTTSPTTVLVPVQSEWPPKDDEKWDKADDKKKEWDNKEEWNEWDNEEKWHEWDNKEKKGGKSDEKWIS